MAARTGRSKNLLSTGRISLLVRLIWRHLCSLQIPGFEPARPHALDQGVYLRIRQHATCALRKGRHECSCLTIRDDVAQCAFVHNGLVFGIGQSKGRPVLTVRAVAPGTVLRVETVEVGDLIRAEVFRTSMRSGRKTAASSSQKQAPQQNGPAEKLSCIHGRRSSPSSTCGCNPDASIPMRRTKGMDWLVWI